MTLLQRRPPYVLFLLPSDPFQAENQTCLRLHVQLRCHMVDFIHHAFPPLFLLIQSRAASCCSTLAAALKSVVLNKAQWSLLDGQWGEYLASVAAIDPDSVHEVCHRLLSPLSCCFFQGPQFTSRCPIQRSRASKLSIRCTTYFWCTLFFFSCFDVFVRFSCVLQRRAASIASHKF